MGGPRRSCSVVITGVGRLIDGRWPRSAPEFVTMALAWIFGGVAIGSMSYKRQQRRAPAASCPAATSESHARHRGRPAVPLRGRRSVVPSRRHSPPARIRPASRFFDASLRCGRVVCVSLWCAWFLWSLHPQERRAVDIGRRRGGSDERALMSGSSRTTREIPAP